MFATLEMNRAIVSDPVSETDEELFLRFRDTGDRDAFEQLVHRYERELFSYLRRYLGDAEMAEDAFQTAFTQVYLIDSQRRNRRHKAISLDRKNSTSESDAGKLVDLLVSNVPDPAANADHLEQGEMVRKLIGQLPENFRQLIQMIYYQGLKYSEVAEALQVPTGTIKSRMHSAVLKLTELWNKAHSEA